MKYSTVLITIMLVISLIGCASTSFLMAMPKVTVYEHTYPSKNPGTETDVFITNKPDRDFLEIAQITSSDSYDSWNMQQILIKAIEFGADAIIFIGYSGSYGAGVTIGDMMYVVTEGHGISAIAIKYK